MSLFAQAFGSRAPVFVVIAVELCAVGAYMGWKGEPFGFSLVYQQSTFNNYTLPVFIWVLQYLLVSAVPILIGAFPLELGPEVFAGIIVWRLLTNGGGVVYVALGELGEDHYLSMMTGMGGCGVSLGLAAVGLTLLLPTIQNKKSKAWIPTRPIKINKIKINKTPFLSKVRKIAFSIP